MPAVILLPLILLTIALVAWLGLSAKARAAGRAGKILLLVGMFGLPGFLLAAGGQKAVHDSGQREFCLSCHEMTPYQRSLEIDDREYLPAVHYQNNLVPRDTACYACHTDYTLYGDVSAKLNGLKHVYVHFLGDVPATGEIHLYSPYPNKNCLKCHEHSRRFEEVKQHRGPKAGLDKLYANDVSCLQKGCHDLGHGVKLLDEMETWKPGVFPEDKPATEDGGGGDDLDDLFDEPSGGGDEKPADADATGGGDSDATEGAAGGDDAGGAAAEPTKKATLNDPEVDDLFDDDPAPAAPAPTEPTKDEPKPEEPAKEGTP
ncbi:MAG: NapC/NirT family cytochrome c [Myxococcales bacterium]|nr:NapC/NirT family cytochrome c [Myxococcales bacterium]MCB9735219.1 NapC/NirT family cytochrome c [Deltaproteobacteria bacterium]